MQQARLRSALCQESVGLPVGKSFIDQPLAVLQKYNAATKGNKGHRLALQWCPDLRKVQVHDVMAVGSDFTSPLEASFLDILEYGVIPANDLGGGESGESAQDLTQNQDQFPETPRALRPPPGFPSTSRKQQHLEQYRHIEELARKTRACRACGDNCALPCTTLGTRQFRQTLWMQVWHLVRPLSFDASCAKKGRLNC